MQDRNTGQKYRTEIQDIIAEMQDRNTGQTYMTE